MMKKLILMLLICLLAGCAVPAANKQETKLTVYLDDANREVLIPEEIDSLMPTGPLSQIVLFALCPEMFAGLGSRWPESAKEIINSEYLNLPYFGQLYGSADLNREMLSIAEPDLLIDIGEYKPSVNEDLDELTKTTGIPVVFVDANLENMPEVYRKLGKLLNKEEKAEKLALYCEKIYAQTERIMSQVKDEKVKVLYCLGEEGNNVLAKGSYHAQMIDWLTENPAVLENSASKGLGNTVSLEQILLWNPEVILFADKHMAATAKTHPVWSELDAIRNEHFYAVPESPYSWLGTPPTVQRLLGMIWLTSVLYPEYFTEDSVKQIQEYYRLFYHCEMTKEDVYQLIN